MFKSKLLKTAMPALPDHMRDRTFYHGAGIGELDLVKSYVSKGIVPQFSGPNHQGGMESIKGRIYVTESIKAAVDYAGTDSYGIILTLSGHDLVKDIIPDEDSLLTIAEKLKDSKPKSPVLSRFKDMIDVLSYKDRHDIYSGDPNGGAAPMKNLMKKMDDEMMLWFIQQPNMNLTHKGRVKPNAVYYLAVSTDTSKITNEKSMRSLCPLLWSKEQGYTQTFSEQDKLAEELDRHQYPQKYPEWRD